MGKGLYIRAETVTKIKKAISDFIMKMLHDPNSTIADRQMILAIASFARKRDIEAATNPKMPDWEYTEIHIHALHPGAMKKAWKTKFSLARIKTLLHCLESSGKLQRNSFGMKVIKICGGLEHVAIENIKWGQKLSQTAAQLVVELCNDAMAITEGETVHLREETR